MPEVRAAFVEMASIDFTAWSATLSFSDRLHEFRERIRAFLRGEASNSGGVRTSSSPVSMSSAMDTSADSSTASRASDAKRPSPAPGDASSTRNSNSSEAEESGDAEAEADHDADAEADGDGDLDGDAPMTDAEVEERLAELEADRKSVV